MKVTLVQALNEQFKKVSEELHKDLVTIEQYDIGYEEGYLSGLMYAIELVKKETN